MSNVVDDSRDGFDPIETAPALERFALSVVIAMGTGAVFVVSSVVFVVVEPILVLRARRHQAKRRSVPNWEDD